MRSGTIVIFEAFAWGGGSSAAASSGVTGTPSFWIITGFGQPAQIVASFQYASVAASSFGS